MNRPTENTWLHVLACALSVATLFLVALGGVVTTKGVGMAVPDWPTTYGDHLFLFPPSKWMAGIFYEHSHRLWASLVGLLAAVFAIWVWVRQSQGAARWTGLSLMVGTLGLMGVRYPAVLISVAVLAAVVLVCAVLQATGPAHRLRWLGVIAFAAVIIQGVLGGLRVLLDEHGWGTEFGIFHATLAQVFFLFVSSLAVVTSARWREPHAGPSNPPAVRRLRRILVFTCLLVLGQLVLGAAMRHQHAGLAVPDFPLAYGRLWPATDAASIASYNAHRLEAAGENPITAAHVALHMIHRLTALLVVAAIGWCAAVAWRNSSRGSVVRKLAAAWVVAVLVQATLGILTVLSQRKVDVTTAHVAVGALTFLNGWLLVLAASRSLGRSQGTSRPQAGNIIPHPVMLTHA